MNCSITAVCVCSNGSTYTDLNEIFLIWTHSLAHFPFIAHSSSCHLLLFFSPACLISWLTQIFSQIIWFFCTFVSFSCTRHLKEAENRLIQVCVRSGAAACVASGRAELSDFHMWTAAQEAAIKPSARFIKHVSFSQQVSSTLWWQSRS